jgi:hypothetical protein
VGGFGIDVLNDTHSANQRRIDLFLEKEIVASASRKHQDALE